jgi:hypothetical protein
VPQGIEALLDPLDPLAQPDLPEQLARLEQPDLPEQPERLARWGL